MADRKGILTWFMADFTTNTWINCVLDSIDRLWFLKLLS